MKQHAPRLFGTDGIRGLANAEPMTPGTVLKVAMAVGNHFRTPDTRRHLAVIGKDTRLSGYMLEPALVAGLTATGIDVVLAGPLPTPAIALLTRSMRADLGIVISASHNPYEDNGIKLFGPDGFKLSDDIEAAIAGAVVGDQPIPLATADQLGRAKRLDDAAGRYIEAVKSTFPRGRRLDGLKVVVDCANGAAYKVAPTVLWELGADVTAIGVAPDGFNINRDCGAVHVDGLAREVVRRGADLGIALDGDADRLIVVDERGHTIDGDQILALIATSWSAQDRLRGSAIAATVMSNLGLERHLAALGLTLVRTPVGDRHVAEAMRRADLNVGGEQSGHILLTDYATTGDGLIAALQVLAVVTERAVRASEVMRVFTPFPQLLRNLRLQSAADARLEHPTVRTAIAAAEARLGGSGRILVRKSGTEPLVRIMAEAEDHALVSEIVEAVAHAIDTAAS